MSVGILPQSRGAIEAELFATAVHARYGYDFRDYKPEALLRRLSDVAIRYRLDQIDELTQRVLQDPAFFQRVLSELTVTVTELFRDPLLYRRLRDEVLPYLRTFPIIRVWHAGCATGEEPLSMAILLEEAGLLERSIVYATDINPRALDKAKRRVVTAEALAQGERNYAVLGGAAPLARHFESDESGFRVLDRIMSRLVFLEHDLVTDGSIGEMHLIVCRNVFIYFGRKTQSRITDLFRDSLYARGYLCLGTDERLEPTPTDFEELSGGILIYRKRTVTS